MPAHLQVLRPGPLTTVQDLGRPGRARFGVPRSGAADRPAHALANRLVGNPPGAATLETTLAGCRVLVRVPCWAAVTGAPAPVRVGDRPAPFGEAFHLPAGSTLDIGPAVTGLRSYLALSGGIDVPPVLGSRATDLLSGLGPRPLRAGDLLPLGDSAGTPPALPAPAAAPTGTGVLRLVPGPHADLFPSAAWQLLRSRPWTVLPDSNRVGVRLDGPPLPRTGGDTLPSEGMAHGALQVPPSGLPVLFLADHPTTGGYPVLGCVRPDDLPQAAQARPGAVLRFAVDPLGVV